MDDKASSERVNGDASQTEVYAEDDATSGVEESEESGLGFSRRGLLVSGGLLGLLGLGGGSASADASGQIGTANDPLQTLHVNKIDGDVVQDNSTGSRPITSFTGGNLIVDNDGNLKTEGGADPISVNDDDTLVQDSNNSVFSTTDSVILGVNNELGQNVIGAVAIGENVRAGGNGSVAIGGNSTTTLSATGNGGVTIGGKNNTNSGTNSVAIGGSNLTLDAASGSFITGERNEIGSGANYSFVAGKGGKTTASHSFVWAGPADVNQSFNPRLVNNTRGKVIFNAPGGFEIIANDDGSTTTPNPHLDVAGTVHAEGAALTSSLRYKSNVRPLSMQNSGVLDLEPKEYERKRSGETEIGLIAEEVDEILPELVFYNEDDEPDAIYYNRVGMLLAPEVSENRDRLETVEAARDVCEEMIETLEVELDAKDARIADQADRIDQLAAENAQLADRLTHLEGQLGTDGAVTGTTPADD